MGEDLIRTAIIGVGNCASSLVQGISYCRQLGDDAQGVLFPDLGGYRPQDIEIVMALDIDRRKVGKPLSEAIFQPPNNTMVFHDTPLFAGVTVATGAVLDGVAPAMLECDRDLGFDPVREGEATREEVIAMLRESGAQVAINFLPVGSQMATEFYAGCALEAGVAFVNAIPVLIASNPDWAARFAAAGLPVLGDDFKAQVGATIMHRTLVSLFRNRGAEIDRSYQLNTGGNTDFLNMLDSGRLTTKRISKTESVQSVTRNRFRDTDLRVGPSDYVPWLKDRKVAFIRMEGRLFGGAPVNVEMRLDVEDSPNAAVMAIAAIRCARIALDHGHAGAIPDVCAFLFKHPPVQMDDSVALQRIEAYAAGKG